MTTVNKKGKKLETSATKNEVEKNYVPTKTLTNFQINNYNSYNTSVQLGGGTLDGLPIYHELNLNFGSNFFIGSDGLRYTTGNVGSGTYQLLVNGVLACTLAAGQTNAQIEDFINTVLYKTGYDCKITMRISYNQSGAFVQRTFGLSVKGFYFWLFPYIKLTFCAIYAL